MTDHTDRGLQLGNFVFDDNNLGNVLDRSVPVFSSFLFQFFVILLILAFCIVKIVLA